MFSQPRCRPQCIKFLQIRPSRLWTWNVVKIYNRVWSLLFYCLKMFRDFAIKLFHSIDSIANSVVHSVCGHLYQVYIRYISSWMPQNSNEACKTHCRRPKNTHENLRLAHRQRRAPHTGHRRRRLTIIFLISVLNNAQFRHDLMPIVHHHQEVYHQKWEINATIVPMPTVWIDKKQHTTHMNILVHVNTVCV